MSTVPEQSPKPARERVKRALVSLALGVALAFVCHALPVPYQIACNEVSKVVQALVGGPL